MKFLIILVIKLLIASSLDSKLNSLHICKNCKHYRIINGPQKENKNMKVKSLEICKLGLDINSNPGIIQYKTTFYMRNSNDPDYDCGHIGKYFTPKPDV